MPIASAADKISPLRNVEGKVLDSNDNAIPGAIVYIRDMNTMKVLNLFADNSGAFNYEQLLRSTDYRIWAEYKGKKSPEKLLSSFDNITNLFQVRLRIDTTK